MNWINVVQSLVLTTGVAMAGVFFGKLQRWWWYVLIFIWMFAGGWLFESRAHAYDYPVYYTEMGWFDVEAVLSDADRTYYEKQLKFHTENAQRTYNDAKERCWWLPKLSERDSARYCWRSVGALLLPGTPEF